MISCLADGAVNLYYDNAKKFETTSAGATVTGGITTTTSSSFEGGVVLNDASADVDFRVESNGNASMLFVDGGANRVGIGTSSPGATLETIGTAGNNFKYATAGTYFSILPEGPNGNVSLRFRANSGSAPDLIFKNDAASEVVRIQNSGKVGIGTSSPATNLEIRTTASDNGILLKSTGNTGSALDFDANRTGALNGIGTLRANWNGNGVSAIYLNAGSDTTNKDDGMITFNTRSSGTGVNPPERMRIDNAGNVLVGKTAANYSTPGIDLKSNGNLVAIRDSGNVVNFVRNSSDGSIVTFARDTTNFGTIGVASSKLHIASVGNSGIRFRDDLN